MSLRAQARKRLLLLGTGLLVIAGLVGGAFTWHQMRLSSLMAEYRTDGLAAAKSGDNLRASKLLAIYLNRRDPNDIEVLTAYAQALPKIDLPNGQEIRLAIEALHRILSLDAHRPDQWRELMEIYHDRLALSTEANQAADNLLAQLPGDGEALRIKVAALLNLRQYNDALAAAQTCLAAHPQDWITQFNRLYILNQLQRPAQEILDTAQHATQASADDQGALLVRARAYELVGDPANTEISLRAAAARPCNDKAVGLLLLSQLDFRGMYAQSLELVRNMAQAGDPKMEQLLLRRLWESNRSADVVALGASSAAPSLKDPESQGMYADALHKVGKDSQSQTVLQGLKSLPDDLMSAAWLAIANIESSSSAGNIQSFETARAACAAAAQQYRLDPYLLYYQAKASAMLGETDAAIDLWTQSAKLARAWPAPLLAQAQTLLNIGRQDDAARASEAAFARDPSSTPAAITEAMVLFAAAQSGSSDAAAKLMDLIDQIQQRAPGEEQTLQMRVVLQARAGQTAKAAATLRAMLSQSPPVSAKTLSDLTTISRQWRLGLETACDNALREHYSQNPGAVLAVALDDAQQQQQAEKGLAFLQAAAKSAPADQAVGFRLAMATFLEKTQDKTATSYWVDLGDALPDDLAVQQGVLSSEAAYQNRDFYDRSIERMHKLLGDDAITWQVARARWLLDGSPSPQAAADATVILENALKHTPNSLAAHVLLGMAKKRAGDLNGATEQYTIAQRLNPNSPAMALDLARLLQARGDFDAAQQQLETAAKVDSSPEKRVEAAAMLAAQGDYQQAISILEPITNAQSPQPQKLALASLYARIRNFDRAGALTDQLLQHPDAPSLLLAAQIDMAKGQPQAAEQMLARLNDVQAWRPGALQRTLAQFRESLNQLDQAQALDLAATQAAPNDPAAWLDLINCQAALGKPADIQATVDQAIQHLPDNAQLTAIKSQSALLPYGGSDWTGRQLLLALINDPSPAGPAVTALGALKDIAAADSSDALSKLEKLADSLPRFLPAQMVLTDMQMRMGRTDDAIRSAMQAMQAFPTQPRPAELAVACLVSSGRLDEALQLAQTWRGRLEGDQSPADLEIARLHLRHGDAAAALTALQPYLNAPGLSAAQKWQVQLTQAMALLQQGQSDHAAQVLWPMVQTNPALWRTWTSFIINLPPAHAETWLNRFAALPKSTPADSAQAQLTLASAWDYLAHKSGQARYATMARDLIHQVEQDPAAAPQAYLQEGILDEESGDPASAKAAYTRASAAKNPEAQNNLASLLVSTGGDLTQAVDLATQCVRSNPNQPAFYDTLADALRAQEKYDPAIDAMQHAIRLEPGNPKWHVNLAKILVAAGKRDQAKQAISDLDLMSPGVTALPQAYQQRLDDLRKQLASASAAVSLTH